jgi:hypothetical protein
MAVDVRITAVTPVLFFHSTPFALKKTLLRASTRKIIHFRECNQDPRLDDMMPSGIRQTERKKKKRKKKVRNWKSHDSDWSMVSVGCISIEQEFS